MPFGSTRGPIDPLSFPEPAGGPLVVVTGATGQLGSHVTLILARAGFRVRATTRDASRAAAMVQRWPSANIEWVVVADHKGDNVYDEAFRGCEGVFNCAGPFTFKLGGAEVIDQNLKGITNVLTASAKEPKIRRIIHISSVAAVFQHDADFTNQTKGITYDETCVQDEEALASLKKRGETLPGYAYNYSKTAGELLIADWRSSNSHSFDVVTLCPCTLYGPVFQAWGCFEDMDAASNRLWHHILDSKSHMPEDRWPVFTNVHDAAEVCMKSFLYPVASNQRYLMISGEYTYAQIFSIIRRRFPQHAHRLPEVTENPPRYDCYTVDVSKAERDLGIRRWSSLENTIVPHVEALFDLEKRSSQ